MSTSNGRRRWDWMGTPPGALDEQYFWSSAARDPLTDLCARESLMARLDEALARPRTSGDHLALVLCSIEGFERTVADFGPKSADALLLVASRRLRSAIRSHDIAARWDVSQFAVLADWLPSERVVTSLSMRFKDAMSGSYALSDASLDVVASVAGVVARPGHTLDSFLAEADEALTFGRSTAQAAGSH